MLRHGKRIDDENCRRRHSSLGRDEFRASRNAHYIIAVAAAYRIAVWTS